MIQYNFLDPLRVQLLSVSRHKKQSPSSHEEASNDGSDFVSFRIATVVADNQTFVKQSYS